MSWWTKFRDGFESAAAVVANYFYPGVGTLAPFINSKGSQAQLNTNWGRGLMLLSGVGGGVMGTGANYGATMDALSGGGTSGFTAGSLPSGFSGGASGAGTVFGGGAGETASAGSSPFGITPSGAQGTLGTTAGSGWEAPNNVFGGGQYGGAVDPSKLQYAQQLIASGYPADQAYLEAGISPQQGAGAGTYALQGEAIPAWQNAAAPGAGPTFQNQQTMGVTSTPGTIPASAGDFNYTGGFPNAAAEDAFNASKLKAASGAAGAMPWGSPGNLLTMAQGAYGLYASNQLQQAARRAQQQADPFGPYRQQYADKLSQLSSNPGSITSMPGYQAGMDAIQRSMAAQGYTGSGNMMGAMAKYGGDFYNNAMNMYSGLAGAGINPGTGAQLGLQGNQAAVSLAGNSLNRLGYGAWMAGNKYPPGYNPNYPNSNWWPGMGG